MAEVTIETLTAQLNALRSEFEIFKAYATPVIEQHEVKSIEGSMYTIPIPPPLPPPTV